jgi:hypothetical protein
MRAPPRPFLRSLLRWLPVPAVALVAGGAAAAELTVVNGSFEAPYGPPLSNLPAEYGGDVPPSAFPVGQPPTGWTLIAPITAPANVGVLHPSTGGCPTDAFFPDGAPDGENVLLLYHGNPGGGPEYGVAQDLGVPAQPNTRYRLEVQVGNIGSGTSCVQPYQSFGFFGIDGFPGYRVQLLAGGVVVAEDVDGVTPPEGVFEAVSVTWESGESPPAGELSIRLISRNRGTTVPGQDGVEVDFDAVRLFAGTPASAVPALPLAAGACLAALLLVFGGALRRSARP